MSADLKVGDVAVVLHDGNYFPAGHEVEVIGGPRMYPLVPPTEESFQIRDASGIDCWAYRSTLRKKPPKSEPDATPREDFTPADPDFREDLQRRLNKKPEVA